MQIKSNILNKFKRLEKMIVWLRFVPKREDTFNKERLFDFIDRVNECLCNRSYFECEIERKIPSYYGKYEIDYVIQIFYNIDVLIDVDYNYVLVVYEIPLSSQGLDLSIEDILKLHGISMEHGEGSGCLPTYEDAQKILRLVLNDLEITDKLYEIHRVNNEKLSITDAKKNPIKINDYLGMREDRLSVDEIPGSGWHSKDYKKWNKFLHGGWLEIWVGELVKSILDDGNVGQVLVGVNCKRENKRKFEIDVIIIRGYRLYVISCTTDKTLPLCKSKLFEVAIRARQLGGDLARSAMVALINDGDDKGPFVDQLRNDIADIWDAPNTPEVFGLDDIKEWEGIEGAPDVMSLKNWLNS